MRQVRGVTQMTVSDTDLLVTKYQQLADELNTTTTNITTMSLEMYRQGLTAQETAARMESIVKLAGIENLEVGAVTEYVTAGVNSFQRLGLSAEEYGDKVAKAAAVSATSVDEISKGLQRSSNIASVTGLSFSELTSYISTVSSVSRLSASTIGNSMKGILARFSKINEMGEDNTIVYGQVKEAVESVGISFADANNRMRPVGDVMTDIAGKWKTLTKEQQNYLAAQIGGTYHVDKVLTLFNNWDMQMRVHSEIMNSAGEVDRQYGEKIKSIRGSVDALKNAFQDLALKTLNSDTSKAVVDIVTQFVQLIDKIGVANIAIMGLVFALNSLRGSLAIGALVEFATRTAMVAQVSGGWTAALYATRGAVVALKAAMAALWPVLAVMVIVKAVQMYQEYEEQLKATKEAQLDFNDSLKDFNDSMDTAKIDEMTSSIEKMKQALKVEDATKELSKLNAELEKVQQNDSGRDIQQLIINKLQERIGLIKTLVDMEAKEKKAKEDAKLADVAGTEATMKLTATKILDTQQTINQINANKEAAKTNESLIRQYPQYVKVLDEKTGAVGLDVDALLLELDASKNLADVELSSLKLRAQAQITFTQNLIGQTNTRILAINSEIEALKKLAQGQIDYSQKNPFKTMSDRVTAGSPELQGLFRGKLGEELTTLSAQKSQYESNIEGLKRIANMSTADLAKIGSSGAGGPLKDGSKSSKESKDKEKSILDNYKAQQQAISDINSELTILNSKLSLAEGDERIAAQNAIIEATKRHQQSLRDYNTELRKIKNPTQEVTDEMTKNSEAWWSDQVAIKSATDALADYAKEAKKVAEEKLSEEIDKVSKAFDKMSDVFDSTKDSMDSAHDSAIDAIDDQIEALERQYDATNDLYERTKLLAEIEERRAILANTLQEKNVKLYTGVGATGFEWVADPRAVQDAQESLADSQEALYDFDIKQKQDAEKKKLEDTKEALRKTQEAEALAFETRKKSFESFTDNIEAEMALGHEITKEMTDGWLANLSSAEQASYAQRIIDVMNFVNAYNYQLSMMQSMGYVDSDDWVSTGEQNGGEDVKYSKSRGGYDVPGIGFVSDTVGGDNTPLGKATGGPVNAGQTYRVNENGIESMLSTINNKDYITPLTNGTILTASQTSKALSGGSGQSIVFTGDINLPNVEKPQDFMPAIIQQIKTYSRNAR